MGAPRHAGSAPRSGERGAAAWPPRAANHRRLARQPQADRDRAGGGGGAAQGGRHHPAGGLRRLCDQVRDRARLVPARHRAPLQAGGGDAAPHALRAHGRHVPRARHAHRPLRLPAAHRRLHRVHRGRPRLDPRPEQAPRRARARRVQRLRRLRLGHLHVPAVPGARHRGVRAGGAAGRRRPHRVQPQGGPRPGRGDQVHGLQRAQAAGGRRLRAELLQADRDDRGRAGHALPGADARRAALARRQEDRPLHLHERHEVRRARQRGHRGGHARRHPGGARARRREGRDRRQGLRRLLRGQQEGQDVGRAAGHHRARRRR
mmetsp:Transcript_19902/g.50342  ORF Transcript_19902/g.50342 Transcript_19902/m.50342 type:complete len:319 (-) Transcript_19902:399-1355(-)